MVGVAKTTWDVRTCWVKFKVSKLVLADLQGSPWTTDGIIGTSSSRLAAQGLNS